MSKETLAILWVVAAVAALTFLPMTERSGTVTRILLLLVLLAYVVGLTWATALHWKGGRHR
jgi:hypothetical protein